MKTLEEILSDKINQIAEDVDEATITMNCEHVLLCYNAKQVGNAVPPSKIDAVITSPPYLNGTNYFRNTKLELWFLKELTNKNSLRLFRDDALTSAICDVKKEYSNKKSTCRAHYSTRLLKGYKKLHMIDEYHLWQSAILLKCMNSFLV